MMSTARGRGCAYLSLVFVVIVVCSALFESASTQSHILPSQFEEFLMTLESNETESVAIGDLQPTPSDVGTGVVQSIDGATVSRSDSPDGHSVSDRPPSAPTEADETEGEEEGEEEEEGEDPLNGQTSNELLSYFKYVPRQHWSCCMLGLLAGNKGFQCRADFYSSHITLRNFNRPQTGRHPAGGRPNSGRDRTRGYEIMRTFRRCVSNNAHEFHRCCHVAVTERQELGVARSYRRNRSSSR